MGPHVIGASGLKSRHTDTISTSNVERPSCAALPGFVMRLFIV
jgi:hypothetical protein